MKLSALIAFSLFVVVSFGQQQSLLYSIKGKGIKTAYLFGTMHMVPDSMFAISPKLEKCITKSDELVLEISDISNQAKALKLLNLEKGSAFDIFSAQQADSVINWGANSLGITPEAFKTSFTSKQPFVLLQLGSLGLISGKTRYYETEMQRIAQDHELILSGLETMEFQFSLFQQLPDSIMASAIMEMVRSSNEQSEQFTEMLKLYQAQDVEGLSQLINSGDDILGNTDALLTDRNEKWVPIIEEKIKLKSCFIAVGAGHLGGENGLINLLTKSGYTVSPISY